MGPFERVEKIQQHEERNVYKQIDGPLNEASGNCSSIDVPKAVQMLKSQFSNVSINQLFHKSYCNYPKMEDQTISTLFEVFPTTTFFDVCISFKPYTEL